MAIVQPDLNIRLQDKDHLKKGKFPRIRTFVANVSEVYFIFNHQSETLVTRVHHKQITLN